MPTHSRLPPGITLRVCIALKWLSLRLFVIFLVCTVLGLYYAYVFLSFSYYMYLVCSILFTYVQLNVSIDSILSASQFAVAATAEAVPSSTPPNTSEDAKVAKLVEMGFSADEAQEALRQTGSDLEGACELLAQGSLGKVSTGLSSLMRYTYKCSCAYVKYRRGEGFST